MDVEQSTFYPKLLRMLKDISKAAFVTIDLEMSGIDGRPKGAMATATLQSSGRASKLTLQEKYAETKIAADKFQILQFGFTCMEEDDERDMYVARTYNINVSPLFLEGDRLNIDREITFSSSAVHFLRRNRFDIGAPFESGVCYLSEAEERDARTAHHAKQSSLSKIENLQIGQKDMQAYLFYQDAKKTIHDWVKQKGEKLDFVNIGGPTGLNGYQRRLIHQLVRSEFPALRCFAQNNGAFMQIEKIDVEREARFSKQKEAVLEANIAKQKGLGWIYEALTNGDLSGIDPLWFIWNEDGEPGLLDVGAKTKEIDELREILSQKDILLVGHNVFTDLLFMHKTFVGKLPDHIADFRSELRHKFPLIVDTKYLTSHGGGSLHSNKPLKETYLELKDQTVPFIVTDEKHNKYLGNGTDHEAGWDSLMTAHIFAKLCINLQAARHARMDEHDISADEDTEYETAAETSGDDEIIVFQGKGKPINPNPTPEKSKKQPSLPTDPDSTPVKSRKQPPLSVKSAPLPGNRFASLPDEADSASSSSSLLDTPVPTMASSGVQGGKPSPSHRSAAQHARSPAAMDAADKTDAVARAKWIPHTLSRFWDQFGNKLQLNGTDVGVWDLREEVHKPKVVVGDAERSGWVA